MVRSLLLTLAGFAAGLGAGYLVFARSNAAHAGPVAERPPGSRSGLAEVALPARGPAQEAPAPAAPPPAAAVLPAASRFAVASPGTRPSVDLGDDLAALKGRLAELEQQLDMERKLRRESEGSELRKPGDLPARFSEQAIRDALNRSFKELGFAAEVTAMDCTEYPCIAYGEGFGTREDSERLDKAAALSEYANDAHSVWGWTGKGEEGKATKEFAVAVYPKDDRKARGDELRKRLDYRVVQMRNAGR